MNRKYLIFTLKLVLTGVIVYYVARQVWVNWDQVRQFDWQFDFIYLLLSLVCALVALFVFAAAWTRIVSGFGHILRLREGFRILNLFRQNVSCRLPYWLS